MGNKKTIPWINRIRGLAILAVVLDHCIFLWDIPAYRIQSHLLFSVTAFFLLSGYTAACSLRKIGGSLIHTSIVFYSKRMRIVGAYIIATGIVALVMLPSSISPEMFLNKIISFDVVLPYYFFFILFQLYLFAPLVFVIISAFPKKEYAIILIVLSAYFAQWASLLSWEPIFSYPWKQPFGGFHLVSFVLGMVLPFLQESTKKSISILGLFLFVYFETMCLRTSCFFISPMRPSLSMLAWALGTTSFLYLVASIGPKKAWKPIEYIGQNSLAIFLFHYPILLLVQPLLPFTGMYAMISGIIAVLLPITGLYIFQKSKHHFFSRLKSKT